MTGNGCQQALYCIYTVVVCFTASCRFTMTLILHVTIIIIILILLHGYPISYEDSENDNDNYFTGYYRFGKMYLYIPSVRKQQKRTNGVILMVGITSKLILTL